ncbi:MAG TPA: amidohydrolase family protein [Acidimicrobiia bacterium]|nr:amidohydrolase family protein [Acidimicrobiia bacterium]
MDIIVRSARVRGRPDCVDIGIDAGRIVAIDDRIDDESEVSIDAGGMLTTESFVNPHLHLCKVYTLDRMDELALADYHGDQMGKAMNAIELAARVKSDYDAAWIVPNARKAVALAALHGNTHIRAFADVDTKARLEGINALLQVRDEFAGTVDVQVVAFAQDGLIREPGASGLLREAMELGADVVGGIPWIEFTEVDEQAHVDQIFDLAVEFDKPVSMLVDDAGDPGLRTLEMMAVKAIEKGWQGRALAHHARAMALYPKPYLQKLAALLKAAGIGVVTDPHTGPLHARVRELLDEGVLVCLGQDDVSDAYYPLGRNSMLEVAFLAVHLLWMTTAADMEKVFSMVTTDAAIGMGLADHRLEVGAPANLVVLSEPDVREALRTHAAPAHVISHGRTVDKRAMQTIVDTGGADSP